MVTWEASAISSFRSSKVLPFIFLSLKIIFLIGGKLLYDFVLYTNSNQS